MSGSRNNGGFGVECNVHVCDKRCEGKVSFKVAGHTYTHMITSISLSLSIRATFIDARDYVSVVYSGNRPRNDGRIPRGTCVFALCHPYLSIRLSGPRFRNEFKYFASEACSMRVSDVNAEREAGGLV